MMNKTRIRRLVLPVAGALAVAAAAIAVTASAAGLNHGAGPVAAVTPKAGTGSPSPDGTKKPAAADIAAYCSTFMQNFATDLGKNLTPDQVDAAARKAIGQTIDKAAADGKLTAAQASQAKAAIPSGSLCAAAAALPLDRGGDKHGMQGAGELGKYMGAFMDAAAKAAGLNSAADLKTALAGGQTLEGIAKAHNIDEATFRKNLIANLTPALDAAVTSGKLTADQEKAILAKLQSGPIPMFKGHHGAPKGAPAMGTPPPAA